MSMTGRRANRDDGAVAILVAIFMVVIIAMAAVVVDLGMAFNQRRVAQKAADLAALAAGQDLPATDATTRTTAADTAAAFLSDNGYPGTTGAQLLDLNPANGEIYFTGDAGFTAISGCTAVGTCAQVLAPTQDVQYVFSPAMGALLGGSSPASSKVSAQATVAIKTLGAIFPFVFPDTLQPGGPGGPASCTKDKPNMYVCNTSDTGNFGFADIPRITNDNKRLQFNLRLGAQISPAIIPNQTVIDGALNTSPPVNTPCAADGSPSGAILTNAQQPADGYTCIGTKTGVSNSDLTQGWINSQNNVCDGRLATTSVQTLRINGCYITPDKMLTNYYDQSTKTLSADILTDPRFGVVPVIANTDLGNGSSSQYAIVKFYGVYLRTLYDNNGNALSGTVNGNTKIGGVDSYVFELSLLPSITANVGQTITFLGVGPKTPVLIR